MQVHEPPGECVDNEIVQKLKERWLNLSMHFRDCSAAREIMIGLSELCKPALLVRGAEESLAKHVI